MNTGTTGIGSFSRSVLTTYANPCGIPRLAGRRVRASSRYPAGPTVPQ